MMKGGTICYCSAGSAGGGVYLSSRFTMEGGAIVSNRVTGSQNGWNCSGGGVYVNSSAEFQLTNGRIADNSAPSGGGVVVRPRGKLTMSGGTISGNSATCWGGGVGIESKGAFMLSGGEIVRNATANTDDGLGGGVCSSGGFTMTEGLVRDNVGHSGAQLYLNVDTGKTISGGLVLGSISDENKCLSSCGGVFDAVPSSISNGYESVAVGGYQVVALVGTAAQASGILTAGRYRFDPLDVKYLRLGIVTQQDFYSTIVGQDPNVWQLAARKAIDCGTWSETRANLAAGNDVRLTGSFTVRASDQSVTVAAGRSPTLDLDGNAITSKLASALFDLTASGAALTVTGDGQVVNAATGVGGHNGGCFNVTAGSLKISGGLYEGFGVGSGYDGGCVYVGDGASFTLSGGVISNCYAWGSGGAIASRGTCVIGGGVLTRNSAVNPGGAVAVLNGKIEVSGCEFAANGTSAAGGATVKPANGAALAVLENAKLTMSGGWFHDNVTQAAEEKTGTGAAVYLKLRPAGSATILGGLFGANRMGGSDEIRNILVDASLGGDSVTLTGGFFCRQNPSTLAAYTDAAYESVPVRTNWWAVGLRDTICISNDRVNEGTFTFDPKGEPCYVLENLVPDGARTICTPATGTSLATWQLTGVAEETLYYEGRCILPDGTAPKGIHMFRTYLTTSDGLQTSATNQVAVQIDTNGFYASQTSLDICGFFERFAEAYLAIDIFQADGTTLVQREPRQKIGFVPYAIHAAQAESVKMTALTNETLNVSSSARIGTLRVSSALTVANMAVITNDVSEIGDKVSNTTIDRLHVVGAGTSLLEPIGGMSLDPAARSDWKRIGAGAAEVLNPHDGTVSATVNCTYDGVLFIVCTTADAGALDLQVTRTGNGADAEEIFARNGLVAADGKGYDLSTPVVRGDRVTISAKVTGAGTATVAYRYVSFGMPREEK